MADSKRIAKQVLHGIGKGFILCGKGILFVSKAIGRTIQKDYERSQQNQRKKEAEREYYRQIAKASYADEVGRQQAIAKFKAIDRRRRENEQWRQQTQKDFDNELNNLIKVNRKATFDNPFEEPNSRKRKKKSNWDL